MTVKKWMKVPCVLRDLTMGKLSSLFKGFSPRQHMVVAVGMILILAGLCLFILLGGAEPEAGTPSMSTAIEIVTPENIE